MEKFTFFFPVEESPMANYLELDCKGITSKYTWFFTTSFCWITVFVFFVVVYFYCSFILTSSVRIKLKCPYVLPGHGLDPWRRVYYGVSFNIWWVCHGCVPGCGCGSDPVSFGGSGLSQVKKKQLKTKTLTSFDCICAKCELQSIFSKLYFLFIVLYI